MRKRGQAEIIGILIVVFIVSIGLFYVVMLKLNQRDPGTFTGFQDTELAKATLLALLYSDIDGCVAGTVYDNIRQMGFSGACPGLQASLDNILENTLGEERLNRVYYYEIHTCSDSGHTYGDSCVEMAGPPGYNDADSDTGRCALAQLDTRANQIAVETVSGVKYYFSLKVCRV